MKRTLLQRCTDPQSNVDHYIRSNFKASTEAAGKSWEDELRRLAGMSQVVADSLSDLATATEEPEASSFKPIMVPAIRRDKPRGKTKAYKAEWSKLSERQQRSQHNLDSFIMRREHGLVDSLGQPTMPKR